MAIEGGEPVPLVKGRSPVWSPDGRRLAFVSNRSGARRLWVSDANGLGGVEIKDEALGNPFTIWLPDGRLAWPTPDRRNYRIRDLGTGEDELLMKEPTIGGVFGARFSPRGDQAAIFWNRPDKGGLWTVSWPAREERFLAPDTMVPDGWSPDGEWIYAHQTGTSTIVKISIQDGTVQPLGTFPIGVLGTWNVCAVTPDARAVVCSLLEIKGDVARRGLRPTRAAGIPLTRCWLAVPCPGLSLRGLVGTGQPVSPRNTLII
jgi:WD40-like Beta Propeller Repeat